jgi:glycosyltransferase involved in cell wall biosynthesis
MASHKPLLQETGPIVALVDWHWIGHHPAFFHRFADTLARDGATVVPFVPRPADFDASIAMEASSVEVSGPGRIAEARAAAPTGGEWWIHSRIGRCLRQLLRFSLLRRQLDRWERESGRKIDVVFFACIYDWEFDFAGRWVGTILARPWAGLYLQARHVHAGKLARVARMFSCPRLLGLATLDGDVAASLKACLAGLVIVPFPEVVDARLPAPGQPTASLARKIRDIAGDRPIVSLVGWLQRSKGVEHFTALARDPRVRDVFFVLCGEFDPRGMPANVARELLKAWETTPNLHAHLERMEEADLNAILEGSNAVFAAYVDFPYSSNILVKAAILGRPVIVSRGFLMGTIVERYRLGITVPQGDIDAMVEAVLSLTNPREAAHTNDVATAEALRAEFLQLHSDERLRTSFVAILARLQESRRPNAPAVASSLKLHLPGQPRPRGKAPPTE